MNTKNLPQISWALWGPHVSAEAPRCSAGHPGGSSSDIRSALFCPFPRELGRRPRNSLRTGPYSAAATSCPTPALTWAVEDLRG